MSADMRPDVHLAIRAYIQAGKRGLDMAAAMQCALDEALASQAAQGEAVSVRMNMHTGLWDEPDCSLAPETPAAVVTDCTPYEKSNGDGTSDYVYGVGTFMCETKLEIGTKLYAAPPAPAMPDGWREVIKRAREGLAAGERSRSGGDYELEFGGALIDGIEELLEGLAAAPEPAP